MGNWLSTIRLKDSSKVQCESTHQADIVHSISTQGKQLGQQWVDH